MRSPTLRSQLLWLSGHPYEAEQGSSWGAAKGINKRHDRAVKEAASSCNRRDQLAGCPSTRGVPRGLARGSFQPTAVHRPGRDSAIM